MPTAQGTLRFASCSALRHSTWRRALDKPLPRRVLAAARQRLLRHFNSPSFCRQAGPRAMATQCSGQPLDEGDEHGPVRPIQACSWLGSAEHGGLLPQHDELDVLAGGRAAHQEDQSEQLTEDQVQPAQRDAGIMSDHRSPLVSDPVPSSGTPQALAPSPTQPDRRRFAPPPRRRRPGRPPPRPAGQPAPARTLGPLRHTPQAHRGRQRRHRP